METTLNYLWKKSISVFYLSLKNRIKTKKVSLVFTLEFLTEIFVKAIVEIDLNNYCQQRRLTFTENIIMY